MIDLRTIHIVILEYFPDFTDGRTVRIKSLSDYLSSFGINVVIYSLSNKSDESLSGNIRHVRIKYPGLGFVKSQNSNQLNRKFIPLLGAALKKIGRIFFPDRYLFGMLSLSARVKQESRPGDHLFISMPPFSALALPAFLISKKKFRSITLDYRDLFVENEIFVSSWLKKKLARWLERVAISNIDLIISTTESAKAYFESYGKPSLLIANGITQEELDYIKNIYSPVNVRGATSVGYFGNLGHKRDSKMLISTLLGSGVKLSLYGNLDRDHALICGSNYHGVLDRKSCLMTALDFAFLLVVIRKSENSDYAIPGKIYEAVSLRRPILLYCPIDALVLGYLSDIKYPHFHIDSENESNISNSVDVFIDYSRNYNQEGLLNDFYIPIREVEFERFKNFLG